MAHLDPGLFAQKDREPRMSIRSTGNYGQRLYYYADKTTYTKEVHVLGHNFLHRINIFHLQNQLAKLRGAITASKSVTEEQLEELRIALHDYTEAIRDHMFILDFPELTKGETDDRRRDAVKMFPEIPKEGFNSHTRTIQLPRSTDLLRRVLKRALPSHLTWTKEEKLLHEERYFDGEPPEWVSPFVDRVARFIVAFVGGMSLIVPMLIMALPSVSVAKSLITTSVAVTFFAIAMSLVFETSNENTVVATATYAAVLFVFVGATSTNGR